MKNYLSFDLIHTELLSRGYTFKTFRIGHKFTRYTAPSGGVWLTHNGLLSYPFANGSSKLISKDKLLSQNLVASVGFVTPGSMEFSQDWVENLTFLHKYAPVVVKPLDSQGSRGLTLGVNDESDLELAVAKALQFSDRVLLQRQFQGEEIRITVSKKRVLLVIVRRTARVVGDGSASIMELIKCENNARTSLKFKYLEYPQLTEEIIASHWFADKRVPAKDEIVELSSSTLVSKGASLYNITDDVHPDFTVAALALADALNPYFLVIDFMVRDYRQPMSPDNYIFLEFTTSPALKMYYGMRGGKQYDIATTLADMIDEYCGVQKRGRLSK